MDGLRSALQVPAPPKVLGASRGILAPRAAHCPLSLDRLSPTLEARRGKECPGGGTWPRSPPPPLGPIHPSGPSILVPIPPSTLLPDLSCFFPFTHHARLTRPTQPARPSSHNHPQTLPSLAFSPVARSLALSFSGKTTFLARTLPQRLDWRHSARFRPSPPFRSKQTAASFVPCATADPA